VTPVISVAAQNRDGGWPYRSGSSWTEPTAWALLAQTTEPQRPAGFQEGLDWLRRTQREDGGWPPQPAIEQSTWVTALVALLPPETIGGDRHARAVKWLMSQSGQESTWVYRLRQRLLGNPADTEAFRGWPWFPGTAAWVTPTAIALLALEKAQRRRPGSGVRERIEAGRQFLLARRCADGGWNHGTSRALGYDAPSYPETTGAALLALHEIEPRQLAQSLSAAERRLRSCRSGEGRSWLRLGLLAHHRPVPVQARPAWRSVPDAALCQLAQAAERGRNLFLE